MNKYNLEHRVVTHLNNENSLVQVELDNVDENNKYINTEVLIYNLEDYDEIITIKRHLYCLLINLQSKIREDIHAVSPRCKNINEVAAKVLGSIINKRD